MLLVDSEDIAPRVNSMPSTTVSTSGRGGLGRSTTAGADAFYDDNTQVAWAPVVGGANVVELNKVLSLYNVALGGGAWEGGSTYRFRCWF